MSDDSISDTGDINEGEGAKVVQSSFREPSIMVKNTIKQDLSPTKLEEFQIEKKDFSPEKPAEKAAAIKDVPKTQKKPSALLNEFSFEIPKMHSIPIVNKDTTHPDRFDLDFLLNPEVQKIAKSGHRLTQSTTINITSSFVNSKNHIKQNIHNAKSHTNSISHKELSKQSSRIGSKKSSFDVDERFYNKAKKTEEKIKALKELKEIDEINGCTFHPKIRTSRKPKTYEEFFNYMNGHTERKEKKVKSMQEEVRIAYEKSIDFTYQPKLCEKSLQLIAKKSIIDETVVDRLHKFYKHHMKSENVSIDSPLPEEKTGEQRFFHPLVNKRSKEMQRSDPVDKILYDDALRRLNKDLKPKAASPVKFITGNSEKFLIEKLKREFEEAFDYIDIDSTNEVNYTRMIELFKLMHLVKENGKHEEERLLLLETWKILSEDVKEYCNKSSVLAFIMAIIGFYEDWMETNIIGLSLQEVKKIHKKFDLFYTNRTSVINKISFHKPSKEFNEYSFQPDIKSAPEKVNEEFKIARASNKLEDVLIAEKEKVQKKIEELRQQRDLEVMEECSFNPITENMPEEFRVYGSIDKEDLTSEYFKLIKSPESEHQHKGLVLYNLSKVYKEKKEVIAMTCKEKEILKELESCTFTPHLEKRIFPEDFIKKEVSPKKVKPKIQKMAPSKSEKKIPPPIVKVQTDGKDLNFFNVISKKDGIAKISVKVGDLVKVLDFNTHLDDPTNVVMAFSSKFGLKKDSEYKLVKKLTILKYECE